MVGFAAAGVASLMHTAQHADHHRELEPIFDVNPSIRNEVSADDPPEARMLGRRERPTSFTSILRLA